MKNQKTIVAVTTAVIDYLVTSEDPGVVPGSPGYAVSVEWIHAFACMLNAEDGRALLRLDEDEDDWQLAKDAARDTGVFPLFMEELEFARNQGCAFAYIKWL